MYRPFFIVIDCNYQDFVHAVNKQAKESTNRVRRIAVARIFRVIVQQDESWLDCFIRLQTLPELCLKSFPRMELVESIITGKLSKAAEREICSKGLHVPEGVASVLAAELAGSEKQVIKLSKAVEAKFKACLRLEDNISGKGVEAKNKVWASFARKPPGWTEEMCDSFIGGVKQRMTSVSNLSPTRNSTNLNARVTSAPHVTRTLVLGAPRGEYDGASSGHEDTGRADDEGDLGDGVTGGGVSVFAPMSERLTPGRPALPEDFGLSRDSNDEYRNGPGSEPGSSSRESSEGEGVEERSSGDDTDNDNHDSEEPRGRHGAGLSRNDGIRSRQGVTTGVPYAPPARREVAARRQSTKRRKESVRCKGRNAGPGEGRGGNGGRKRAKKSPPEQKNRSTQDMLRDLVGATTAIGNATTASAPALPIAGGHSDSTVVFGGVSGSGAAAAALTSSDGVRGGGAGGAPGSTIRGDIDRALAILREFGGNVSKTTLCSYLTLLAGIPKEAARELAGLDAEIDDD